MDSLKSASDRRTQQSYSCIAVWLALCTHICIKSASCKHVWQNASKVTCEVYAMNRLVLISPDCSVACKAMDIVHFVCSLCVPLCLLLSSLYLGYCCTVMMVVYNLRTLTFVCRFQYGSSWALVQQIRTPESFKPKHSPCWVTCTLPCSKSWTVSRPRLYVSIRCPEVASYCLPISAYCTDRSNVLKRQTL